MWQQLKRPGVQGTYLLLSARDMAFRVEFSRIPNSAMSLLLKGEKKRSEEVKRFKKYRGQWSTKTKIPNKCRTTTLRYFY